MCPECSLNVRVFAEEGLEPEERRRVAEEVERERAQEEVETNGDLSASNERIRGFLAAQEAVETNDRIRGWRLDMDRRRRVAALEVRANNNSSMHVCRIPQHVCSFVQAHYPPTNEYIRERIVTAST
jgi:hypothetical protein